MATDVCWWTTFLAVLVCFGGRALTGQFVLGIGASVTAGCWLLHCLTRKDSAYHWTGSEVLWLLGIAIGIAQIVPLPREWLLKISPHLKEILPLWFDERAVGIFKGGWNQLSLAPWDVASGLATFVGYALMFLVAAQRIQTLDDAESQLCGVGIVAISMAVFALVQMLASNGKFYWIIEHPYMTTDLGFPNGSFTNRSHLSEFLAMGVGPLLWWIQSRMQQQKQDREAGTGMPESWHLAILAFLVVGLVVTALTALLTISRGGFISLIIVSFICIGQFTRYGVLSPKLLMALIAAMSTVACLFFFNGFDSITERLDGTLGRDEIWEANAAVIKDFPILGTGVGTHADAHQLHIGFSHFDEDKEYSHAESGYLNVASETGLAGLVLALLFIGTGLRWCVGSFWHPEPGVRVASAAVLGSLLGSSVHAIFDFFWYTPSCMLLLSVQLACACRLYRLTRAACGRRNWSIPLPRLMTLATGGGIAAVAVWSYTIKLPEALAEPDYWRYLSLDFQDKPTDEDELKEMRNECCQAIFRAARLNTHNSRIQEAAGIACLQMFDARQKEDGDAPMSHNEIRAAVLDQKKTQSEQKIHEWVQQVFGKNLKLLSTAKKYFSRALLASPLRAPTYVGLVEISFVDRIDTARDERYLIQAATLRPNVSQTLTDVGTNLMVAENLKGALKYWQHGYKGSAKMREKITKALVPHETPEFFLETFNPDWSGLRTLASGFESVGRIDEARVIWIQCVDACVERLKTKLSATQLEATSLTLRDAYFGIEDPARGIRVLRNAHKQLPQSIPIRCRLGLDLFEAERYSEAAEHLKWCAARNPGDVALQQAAATAIKERLRATASRSSSDPT